MCRRDGWGFGADDAYETEMKLITAAIYTNYTTHIIDDEGIEQVDRYTAHPRANQLILKFERVVEK